MSETAKETEGKKVEMKMFNTINSGSLSQP